MQPVQPVTLYTVGHSNRSLDELLALLAQAGVRVLVDVRAKPASRRFGHFNIEPLRAALEAAGVRYHWAGRQLGGLREPAPVSRHTALAGTGLRGFADYMDTPAFARNAVQLVRLGERAPTAFLCAEREPLDCHRSLIGDWLALEGVRVVHLIGPGERREHALRPEARRGSAGLVYDRGTQPDLLH